MTQFKPTFNVGGKEYMRYENKTWLKVFFDNVTGKNYLENQYAALSINQQNKYSILSYINDEVRVSGKYEFILEWPSVNLFYQWKQSNNPVTEIEQEGVSTATGFEPVHNGSTNSGCWGGLVRAKITTYALLNGCPGIDTWFFAVGMYKTATKEWYDKGYPMNPVLSTYGASHIYLWMRTLFNSKGCVMSKITQRSIGFVNLIIMLTE